MANRRYVNIAIIDIPSIIDFKEFRSKFKSNSKKWNIAVEFTLFVLKRKKPETDEICYYTYDFFQNFESFDALRKIEDPQTIQKIVSCEQTALSMPSMSSSQKLNYWTSQLIDLANTYGYPHTYRSAIHIGKASGMITGLLIGLLIGVFIAVHFAAPPLVLCAGAGITAGLLFCLFFGLAPAGVLCISTIVSSVFGTMLGAAIGAFHHYVEKANQNKLQNQQVEDSSPTSNSSTIDQSMDDRDKLTWNVFLTIFNPTSCPDESPEFSLTPCSSKLEASNLSKRWHV